ncbi:translocation protein [Atractiella rhizophila]|nr:translocation protein [Atractiella rhizophila]
MDVISNQKKTPPEAKNVIDFLRTKSGMKLKSGVLNGKRLMYFKGKSAIKALLSPAYQKLKKVPQPHPKTPEEACAFLATLLRYTFYLKVDRGQRVFSQPASSASSATSPPIKSRIITINPQQITFKEEDYYVWLYEGSQVTTYLGAGALVAIMLAGVMFPLWPTKMRVGAWYVSMGMLGLLGAFFAMTIFRLIFWVITIVVAKPGIWIFPNLFEDVGFVDSFIPLWAWDLPKKKKSKKKSSKDPNATSSKKSRKAPKASESTVTEKGEL